MTEADQTHFHAWLQNPELRALIGDAHIPTMADQMTWFKRVQEPDRKYFSILLADGTLIGNCGFVEIDQAKKEATMRITIGNPEYVGRGLGSEAVKLLTQHAFKNMKLRRLLLKVFKDNERAIKSYQKAGFRTHTEDVHGGKPALVMVLESPQS